MADIEWLAGAFEVHRPHLRAVAYRMLGSLSEADDADQDAWERVSRAGADQVENLKGWLTTIVARVCLNILRSRKTRREESLEMCVPDPIVSPEGELDPEEEALLADSVGLALQVMIDTLAPAERTAFVLHDMFDLPFEEISPMVGRTPQATRQLASRARRRIRGRRSPRRSATSLVNEPWWTPSSPPAVRATSTPWSPCSIPTSWPVPTSARAARAAPRWSVEQQPSPAKLAWARAARRVASAECNARLGWLSPRQRADVVGRYEEALTAARLASRHPEGVALPNTAPLELIEAAPELDSRRSGPCARRAADVRVCVKAMKIGGGIASRRRRRKERTRATTTHQRRL